MRIIAGTLKGRKLIHFKSPNIRPMSDMVKESVFNIISTHIIDSKVLDLFSGTGSLSIESVSRGAKSIIAVDKSKKSISIIKENVKKFELSNQVKIFNQDAFSFLQSCQEKFDVIFADPPFIQKISDLILKKISSTDVLKKNGLVIIQISKHDSLSKHYDNISIMSKKSYSDKSLIIFKRD